MKERDGFWPTEREFDMTFGAFIAAGILAGLQTAIVVVIGAYLYFMAAAFVLVPALNWCDKIGSKLLAKIPGYSGVLSDDIWDWLANSVEWTANAMSDSQPKKDDEVALMFALGLIYAGITYTTWPLALLVVVATVPVYCAAGMLSHFIILITNKLFGGVRGGGELQPALYIGAFIALLATKFSWFVRLVG